MIIIALWIIIGEQLSGASANAYINARLTTLRTPIAGRVSFEQSTLGARIEPQEIVASVQDDRSDVVRRDDLTLERALQAAEISRLEKQMVDIAAFRTRMEERLISYREARIRQITIQLDHARARLDLLREAGTLDQRDARLAEILDEEGQRTRGEPLTYPLAVDYATQRVEILENALQAAEADSVFLGDGYNDAPYAEQRMNELDQRETEVRTLLQEARARLRARDRRLEQARTTGAQMAGAALTADTDSLLWEIRASTGEIVQRGDPIATLADCQSLIVSLSVTENVYNTLRLGQAAVFRPSGSSRTFDATVSRLAGSGADTIYRDLAVAPGPRHLERFDVTLIVPGLAEDSQLDCAIGRTGRVFFDTRPLDWLRGLSG
ncbi:HlyD family secretion protein [Mesobaculum littorinae]|uniref:HlyD family secretion protein n=1 Tax=Mesobaculum littorinae TaxID=2486419 RepID=A0A438AD64_9RHOB|nr:HlyD family secretion protein [Mesobaculum littorinae]